MDMIKKINESELGGEALNILASHPAALGLIPNMQFFSGDILMLPMTIDSAA